MKYTFCAEKHRRRMEENGTPIPVIMEPLLVQMDGKEVETVCDTYDGNTLDYGFVHLIPSFPVKVDLIDCDEETILVENNKKIVVLSKEQGKFRLSFVQKGKGHGGDHTDPEDYNLLWLEIDCLSPFSEQFENESSFQTEVDVRTPKTDLEAVLAAAFEYAAACFVEGERAENIAESLACITENNYLEYKQETANSYFRQEAYRLFQMRWLMDHGITMKDISNEAAKWMDEYRFDKEHYSFESFIAKYGFTGEIYPCYDEFISSEFNDVDFMLNLLPEEKHEGYLRALGVKAQFCKPNETKKQTEDRVGYVRYWSNACGDLHHFGERDITEEELPAELREAYHSIWSERYDFACYLVETADGCRGVALIADFEKDDFAFAKKAAVLLSDYFGGKLCVVLLESSGCDDGHELVVIVPASSSEHYMKDVNEKMYHVCQHR